jgi:hypothetical protein
MKAFLISLLFSVAAFAQTTIPAGTVLPVQLNSTLSSIKSKPGQMISARVMQDVPLPAKKKIHAGAKVLGHIVSVKTASNGAPSEVTFAFTKLKFSGREVAINAHLRALASMMDIEDAQIPPSGTDRGTPWAWATRNLIGGEVAYGQGGPVSRGVDTVGEALDGGVLAAVSANRASGCHGSLDENGVRQALWLFSSNACGVYGIPELQIAHAGRTAPIGQVNLVAMQENVEVRAGSGMLLRINAAGASDSGSHRASGE